MAFDANNEHTQALIETLAAQQHLLDLPRDTLLAIAEQQDAGFVKKLADECFYQANDTAHSRWRKANNSLDWPKFISELEFIAKLPTGPEKIFNPFVGFFNDQFHFFMADMSAVEFREHAIPLDDLVIFMACQKKKKQKAQEGVCWSGADWADDLFYFQDWYDNQPLPTEKGHDDRELWSSLFEISVKFLSD